MLKSDLFYIANYYATTSSHLPPPRQFKRCCIVIQ